MHNDDRAPSGLSRPAYLIAEFDVTGPMPVFVGLLFSSERPETLTYTRTSRLFLVAEEPAEDGCYYGEQAEKLRHDIETDAYYRWCLPHLPPRDEE